jgi:hypothetical protein
MRGGAHKSLKVHKRAPGHTWVGGEGHGVGMGGGIRTRAPGGQKRVPKGHKRAQGAYGTHGVHTGAQRRTQDPWGTYGNPREYTQV